MKKAATALLIAAFLVCSGPLAAFTLVERGSSFEINVKLDRVAMADGSVKLTPGMYRVHVVALGDGSVRASFFNAAGKNAGEAHGIIAVLRQGASPAGAAPGAVGEKKIVDASGKVMPAGSEAASLNFTKLGFGPNSRTGFRTEGQSLKLEIFSGDGTHSILIGLLLPAVQKAREAAVQPGAVKPN